MEKIEFDVVKSLIYEQIRNVLRFYVYEPFNEKLKNEIENRMEALIKPLKDCGSIYDYRFVTMFEESTNELNFSFAFKKEESANFIVAKFVITSKTVEWSDVLP